MINHFLQKHTVIIIRLSLTGFILMSWVSHAADYQVIIKHHQFFPKEIEMKANEKHRLTVINQDDTAEEFESYELNREKVVAGNAQIVVFLPHLKAGKYPFFGEFNIETAQGRIIVK